MFCSKCGTYLETDANFCVHCGQKILSNIAQSPNTDLKHDPFGNDAVQDNTDQIEGFQSKSPEINAAKASLRGDWNETFVLSLIGLIFFVALNTYFDHKIDGSSYPVEVLIGDNVAIFFAVFGLATFVGVVTAKCVTKYRRIPISIVVRKAFWIASIFLALLTYRAYHLAKQA